MSGKGFKSPLKERGQDQTQKHNDVETSEHKDAKALKHNNVETLEHKDAKTEKQQSNMKRMTVYIPTQIARRLKIHASATDQDMSGIITMLVEKYLDKEAD